ncbi:MAG: Lrp/AsnC family transcriptional regulator [Promethearchaeota archaeon]
MINKTLALDDIDKRIVECIQTDPTSTYTEIAKRVHRSQPTVGMRIKKLEDSGILQFKAGLNLKNINCYFAKLELKTWNIDLILNTIKSCPYIIRGYRVSGSTNFVLIVASFNLKDLDKIVNYHFRENPEITNVKVEIITEIYNDFLIPIDLETGTCNCIENQNLKE